MYRILLIVAALTAAPSSTAQNEQERLRFTTETRVVNINVSARDAATKEVVTDLTKDDFVIYENGQPVDIVYFAPEVLPIRIIFLMDISRSMDARLIEVRDSTWEIIRSLRPQDMGKVVMFDSFPWEVTPEFTSDKDRLMIAADSFTDGADTALYTAVYSQVRAFEALERQERSADVKYRYALLVLTDGIDTRSPITDDYVLEAVRNSNVVIYSVLMPAEPPADTGRKRTRNADEEEAAMKAEFFLRNIAEDTGGRMYVPASVKDLEGVYQNIAEEISVQYTLGFRPTVEPDGERRIISVHTPNRNLYLRYRNSYRATR